MIMKRHRDNRGKADAGWLKSSHSFSFGHYHDHDHMGFGPLRVINEDHVIPGAGFGTHPHSNMEIISYAVSGELAHKDSMGNGSAITPGEIQLMSAGSGVTHSEFNGSDTKDLHFLQIWIMPDVENTEASYQQDYFDPDEKRNTFRVVVSPDGAGGSLTIKQDARMLTGHFEENTELVFETKPERKYWLQIVQGLAEINGEDARAGDGFAITDEKAINLKSITQSEILLFDLPE